MVGGRAGTKKKWLYNKKLKPRRCLCAPARRQQQQVLQGVVYCNTCV